MRTAQEELACFQEALETLQQLASKLSFITKELAHVTKATDRHHKVGREGGALAQVQPGKTLQYTPPCRIVDKKECK